MKFSERRHPGTTSETRHQFSTVSAQLEFGSKFCHRSPKIGFGPIYLEDLVRGPPADFQTKLCLYTPGTDLSLLNYNSCSALISAPLLRAAAAVATATVTKSSARECASLDVINHEFPHLLRTHSPSTRSNSPLLLLSPCQRPLVRLGRTRVSCCLRCC